MTCVIDVRDDHSLAEALNHSAESRFRFTQCFLGALPLGDIQQCAMNSRFSVIDSAGAVHFHVYFGSIFFLADESVIQRTTIFVNSLADIFNRPWRAIPERQTSESTFRTPPHVCSRKFLQCVRSQT